MLQTGSLYKAHQQCRHRRRTLLTPQHHACPLSSSAQVWYNPQVMERKVCPPATSTGGVFMLGSEPFPSWPKTLKPAKCYIMPA